ncbi:hypothetical protein CAMRE0001_2652 [Campylobacter rectus RM3267]|uniref:Uncharacterized protein n=1 Tax=Campylobacter rectus RM3267 TaxID=553218 RepID=B9D531_CAMRE|nr:hypothetical protein CAMRE0001_2652 [Campylobacter rectus RM3267]
MFKAGNSPNGPVKGKTKIKPQNLSKFKNLLRKLSRLLCER